MSAQPLTIKPSQDLEERFILIECPDRDIKRRLAAKIWAMDEVIEALQWATGYLEANYSEADMPELATLRAALAKAGV